MRKYFYDYLFINDNFSFSLCPAFSRFQAINETSDWQLSISTTAVSSLKASMRSDKDENGGEEVEENVIVEKCHEESMKN